MSGSPSPFHHRPDPELGAWLAEALAPVEQPAFVARVLAAAAARPARLRIGDVLAGWAGRGIAVAAVALLAALWLARPQHRPAGLAESLAVEVTGDTAASALLAAAPPDPSIVFATFVER